MKRVILFVAFSVSVLAQSTAPPPGQGGYQGVVDVAQLLGLKAEPTAPDRVVAEVDGRKITAGELYQFFTSLPQELQTQYARDRRNFVERYAFILKLADMAKSAKLDEKYPYKDQLAISRNRILMQAKLDSYFQTYPVNDNQVQAYFRDHSFEYRQAKLSGIAVPTPTTNAAAIAGSLLKKWRAGEDIEQALAAVNKENSISLKALDLGWFGVDAKIPENARKEIMNGKTGDVFGPYEIEKQMWVIKIVDFRLPTIETTKDQIVEKLKQQALVEWIESSRKAQQFKAVDEEYFKTIQADAPINKLPDPPKVNP